MRSIAPWILMIATTLHATAHESAVAPATGAAAADPSDTRTLEVETAAGRLHVEASGVTPATGAAPDVRIRFSLGGSRMDYRLRWIRGNPLVVWFDPDLRIENQYVFAPDGPDDAARAVLWSSMQDADGTPIADDTCRMWERHPVLAALAEVRRQLPEASPRLRETLTGNATFRALFEFMTLVDPASVAVDCDRLPVGSAPEHWRDCFAEPDHDRCERCCADEHGLGIACAGVACLSRPGWRCWTGAGGCGLLSHFEARNCAWMACEGKPGAPGCPSPLPDCVENGGTCYYTCPIGGRGHCGTCEDDQRVCCE